jgi:hypothetical protein
VSRRSRWMRAVIQAGPGKAEEEPIAALLATTTTPPGRRLGADPRRQRSTRYRLVPGPLERVPEPSPQRVSHLVVQERVDRQRGSLQQPRLEIGGHPRLTGEHSFQPQRGRVASDGLTEPEALGVRGLDGVADGRRRGWQLRWLPRIADRRVRLLAGGRSELLLRQLAGIRHALILAVGQAVACGKLARRKLRSLGIERMRPALALRTARSARVPVRARLRHQALAGLHGALLHSSLLHHALLHHAVLRLGRLLLARQARTRGWQALRQARSPGWQALRLAETV